MYCLLSKLTSMKNDQLHNSNSTYFSGWDIALRNYDVCEIESIKQLVNSSRDLIIPQLASTNKQSKDYSPLTFIKSRDNKFK